MPRNVKESDDDVETKGVGEMYTGRRTRASVTSSVLDSPLRRSTRIRQPAGQDGSSPESPSDASSVPTTRTTRRRTTTGDSAAPEGGRTLRVRRNSVASDISELTETESLPDGPPKRVTRRSVAGVPSAETPTKINGRTRRTTRAGSETKSTPPVARATRKTRASSMEPEMIEEPNVRQIGTPVKTRKRASVMPSEPAVAEESDDSKGSNGRKSAGKTVYEVDEDDLETSPENIATSLRQKPKDDANETVEKMEVDASPVKASEADTIERSVPDIAEATIDVSAKSEDSTNVADKTDEIVAIDDSAAQKISTPTKSTSHIIENTLTNTTEKQEKSPGNKENEISNIGVITNERNGKLANNDIQPISRKALHVNLTKITEQRRRISSDHVLLVDRYESKTPPRAEKIVAAELENRTAATAERKEYSVDDCVVVLEPININQVDATVVVKQASVISSPKVADDAASKADVNPVLVQHQEEKADTSEKLNVEDNDEVSIIDNDIVDGDSDFRITNVMSMSVIEEEIKKENEDAAESEKKTNQSSEPIEEIELDDEKTVEETSMKVASEDVASDVTFKEPSINTADAIDSRSPINNEKTQEIEENSVCEMVKEKSSIVTESPVIGTSVEETSGLSEEPNKDNAPSVEDSSVAVRQDDETESLPKKISDAESKVLETDNESDCSGFPAFKDITADEWTGEDNERAKKHNEDETNSVHSASTERNESECEIELVDKESLMSGEKRTGPNREAKLDYDTDDTVITQINPTTETEKENEERMKIISEETPMDMSSDLEEDDEDLSNSSKKRSSLPNKNESPALTNVSRRKSFLDTDDESTAVDSPTNDEANISVKSKKSPGKSPKKRISSSAGRLKIDDSSESEDTESIVSKVPKTGLTPNRKSFVAAPKLDTSKNNTSAKNTPSKDEAKATETPAKRRSSNKFASVYSFNDSDDVSTSRDLDCSRMSAESAPAQSSQSEIDEAADSQKNTPATPQDSKGQNNISVKPGSAKKFEANRSVREDDDLTADSNIDEEQLDKSAKQGSAKKSANKSVRRISELERDLESDTLDESVKRGTPKKSSIEKGTWKMTPISMGSPKVSVRESLNESTKSTTSRKLSINKNSVKAMQLDSDSEVGEKQESPAKLNKSKSQCEKTTSKLSALIDSDSEPDLNVSMKTPARAKIISQDKLEKSTKSASAKKSSISRNRSKVAQNNSDSEADEGEESEEKPTKSIVQRASKFFTDTDENYSTIAQVNSDSEAIESSSSDETGDTSLIPRFFFDRDSTSSSNSSAVNDDSSDTIDSDVARDLNLHGKSTLEFSDDDVPADDCMATESESSDSDDDGADLLDFVVDDDEEVEEEEDSFGEEQSNDTFSNVNEKIRKRIITNLDSESDSDNNVETLAGNHTSDLDKSANAKSSKKEKLNKSKGECISSANNESLAANGLEESVNPKTPKGDKKLNKSQEVAEPEIQSADLNVSAKVAAKKNKNLLLQSSTPKGSIREVSLLKKENTPKSVTPLSRSLKNANSSTKIEVGSTPSAKKLSKSVCETIEAGLTPSAKKLSKSVCETIEAGSTPSAKKLSKSVCETIETPTKLGSSFKVAKTPKTPVTAGQQLQNSLPTDLTDSASKTNLSKKKSPKLSSLNQTMMTPNTDTSETRFLMKEKLNDSLPALKLQQRTKVSRRSTLDNVCEEIATTENVAKLDEEIDGATEQNVTIREEADVVPNVGSEKKKNKKKKVKNIDTSKGPEGESLSAPNGEEGTECLEKDISSKKSEKRNKKKKISETETQEPALSKTEEASKKTKKKKKLEENIEELQVDDADKKNKKKKKRLEAVDESHNEVIEKPAKKTKKRDEPVEIAAAPISKNKKRDAPDEVTAAPKSKNKRRDEPDEVAAAPKSKKRLRAAETNVALDADDQKKQTKNNQVQSPAVTRDQRKMKTRSAAVGVENLKTNLKRLPDEILESLSETPERPKKRRKIAKTEKIVPSRTMFDSRHQPPPSLNVDDGYISLSASGGTTQFQVVNLKKSTKKSKKTVAALSFRERMLARNPRQPISAYLMYQQKQKASGKDRPF